MIIEELQKIKSFGSDIKSTITPEDITDKERELGFVLPQALKELYLTFHPDDPAFSGKGNLIPFDELKIYKRICWTDTVITLLPFCQHERYGYGFEVSRYHKSKDIMSNNDMEDPQMWGLYVSPKTQKEEKHLEGREVPCHQSGLSQWILEWLGYQQTLAQPSVVAVNRDKAANYWERIKEFFPNTFYHIPIEQLSSHRTNFHVNFVEEPSRLLCGSILYSGTAYFGGKTDKELEQLMKQVGFKYVWIKSQDGHPIFNSAPPEPPQERELKSITPVLQFLCEFAGIEGKGAKEESINRAEARLGASLPLPMAEFYCYLPSKFYYSYNMVRPLSGLKQTKDGKLNPYLSPIAGITDQIAAGNTRTLYQAMDGQAVGLYDSEECTFWFVTKDEAAQERLETLFDI